MAGHVGLLRVLAVIATVLVLLYLLLLYLLPLYLLPAIWPQASERLWLAIGLLGDRVGLNLTSWLNPVLTALFVYGAGLLLLMVAMTTRRRRALIAGALLAKLMLWLLGLALVPLAVPFVALSALRVVAIAVLAVGGILLARDLSAALDQRQ